jgi:hypothetical protein
MQKNQMPTISVGDKIKFFSEKELQEIVLTKRLAQSDIHSLLVDHEGTVIQESKPYVVVEFHQVQVNGKPVVLVFRKKTLKKYPNLIVS